MTSLQAIVLAKLMSVLLCVSRANLPILPYSKKNFLAKIINSPYRKFDTTGTKRQTSALFSHIFLENMSTNFAPKKVNVVSGVTVRLAGDSGDGMQLLVHSSPTPRLFQATTSQHSQTSLLRSERPEELAVVFLASKCNSHRTKSTHLVMSSIPWSR